MRAKEYLDRIKKIDTLVTIKKQELDDMRRTAYSISSGGCEAGVSGTRDTDGIARSIIAIERACEALNNAVVSMLAERAEITRLLEEIHNPDLINILYRRYYQGDTWERIAVDIGCSYQWVCELHKRGLDEFDIILKKNGIT